MGLGSRSKEFAPQERLSESTHSEGMVACHAWLTEMMPSGCHVIAEGNCKGLLARLTVALGSGNAAKCHQIWLEKLNECNERTSVAVGPMGIAQAG